MSDITPEPVTVNAGYSQRGTDDPIARSPGQAKGHC